MMEFKTYWTNKEGYEMTLIINADNIKQARIETVKEYNKLKSKGIIWKLSTLNKHNWLDESDLK